MIAVFETEEKRPGWDERKLDWFWFTEVQLANDSDTATTIEDVEVRVRTGKMFCRKEATATYVQDISNYKIERRGDNDRHGWQRYQEVPSLMGKIRGQPLMRGIGYRGWVCCDIRQVDQKSINNNPLLDIWLVDALHGKHKVQFRGKSDLQWDQSEYEILKD
jgi:hypothetical protein